MGSEFITFINDCRIQCTTSVSSQRMLQKSWRDSISQHPSQFIEKWSFYKQSYLEFVKSTSISYLLSCSYTIQDPHLFDNGTRKKMMKIPKPSLHYSNRETFEDSGDSGEVEEEIGYLHTLFQIPLRRKQYSCLNISTYDSKWGEVSIHDGNVVFYQTSKPEGVNGS